MVKLKNNQTIGVRYFSDKIIEQNEITFENPSSNCKIVKIKADRVCKDCEAIIPKGTRCYTFNPRLNPRYWVCFDCLPEPNKVVDREVGVMTSSNHLLYYSNRIGRLGQHVSKGQVTKKELKHFYSVKEEVEEDSLFGLHFDDY